MKAMTLSAKRQVVLPADLCRQIALAPGAQVRVTLAPDGNGILIQSTASAGKKSASVLFGRLTHEGKAASVGQLQGMSIAKKLARAGKL
jgi:bifunctional DNA-binding transcriptional regulator/antitoxin component of YhaV-PrlF toxin-antitoxin module